MAKRIGADPGNTHYPMVKLNVWMAGSSILLLACVIWMVMDDWNREWKGYQRDFQEIEADLIEKAFEEEEAKVEARSDLVERKRAAVAALQSKRTEIEAAEAVLADKKSERYNADQSLRKVKADLDWIKWVIEEERHAEGKPVRQEEIVALYAEVDKRKKALEAATAAFDKAKADLALIRKDVIDAETEMAAISREMNRFGKQLEQLRPRTLEGKIAKGVRDAPGLDFMAPSLVVKKTVVENIFFGLNFPGARKKRVDMCESCHNGIAKVADDFTDLPNPHKAHPDLDLYLTDSSPHPQSQFGCTVCHRGVGDTLSFKNADHAPGSPEQRQEWEERYHWKKVKYWDFPMLPAKYTEASCLQCHSDHLELIKDEAPTLYKGAILVEQNGCYGCHKIKGRWETLKKRGPSLQYIDSKMDKTFARSWIANPKDFRPSTRMPQVFHQENVMDPERAYQRLEERDWLAVHSITEYLFEKSKPFEAPAPPVAGDAKRGEEALQLVGCLACHQVDGLTEPNTYNDYGPDLSGIGSKLGVNWIYAWIKDPKKYNPDTRMPNLRVSDQQAADMAAYLASLKKEGWGPEDPKIDLKFAGDVAAEMIDAQLIRTDADKDLRKAIDRGNPDEKTLMMYLGSKFIARQGCFGCHNIPGFESATPIGTELTEWGSKHVDKLDFGNYLAWGDMEKMRHVWVYNKLKSPRMYDKGKIKLPAELLKMPKFDLSHEDREAIVTFLLGLEKTEIGLEAKPNLTAAKRTLNDGAELIRMNNCEGCHVLGYETITFNSERDGHVTLTGDITDPDPDDDEEDQEYYVKLRLPAPTFAEDDGEGNPEGGNAGENVGFPAADFISRTPKVGGGIYPSLLKQASSGGLVILDGEGKEQRKKISSMEELEPYGPPPLLGEGRRVQADWLYEFLKHPETIRPAVGVKMPTFEFTDAQASTLSQYFVREEQKNFSRDFTLNVRRDAIMSRKEFGNMEHAKFGPHAEGLLRKLEEGAWGMEKPFGQVTEFAGRAGFDYPSPPALPFDRIPERLPEYFEEKESKVENYLERARNLTAIADTDGGGGCYKCHWREGVAPEVDPFTWAPDLYLTHTRLRPTWVHRWLQNPSALLPGTKMPLPAVGGEKSAEIFPGTFEDRLEALKDYLMNYEKLPSEAEGSP